MSRHLPKDGALRVQNSEGHQHPERSVGEDARVAQCQHCPRQASVRGASTDRRSLSHEGGITGGPWPAGRSGEASASRVNDLTDQPLGTHCALVMSPDREWPFEQAGDERTRPWFLSATGHLFALFINSEEAQRAEQGLVASSVPVAEIRIDPGAEIVAREAERAHESSSLTKALTALTADQDVYEQVLNAATAGGSVLWARAPTDDAANRLIRLLADYDYAFIRYYGPTGPVNISGAE